MTTPQNESKPRLYVATYSLETEVTVVFEAHDFAEASKLAGDYGSPVSDMADEYIRQIKEGIWDADIVLNAVHEATEDDLNWRGDEDIIRLPTASE